MGKRVHPLMYLLRKHRPSIPNLSPSPAVYHNRCTSAFKLIPDLLNKFDQGRRLTWDSVVWPSCVLELFQTEGSIMVIRGLKKKHTVIITYYIYELHNNTFMNCMNYYNTLLHGMCLYQVGHGQTHSLEGHVPDHIVSKTSVSRSDHSETSASIIRFVQLFIPILLTLFLCVLIEIAIYLQ